MLNLCIRAASGSSQTSRGASCASETAATCATPPPLTHFTSTTVSCSPFHSTPLRSATLILRSVGICSEPRPAAHRAPSRSHHRCLASLLRHLRPPLLSQTTSCCSSCTELGKTFALEKLFCKLSRRGRIDKVSAAGG